MLTSRPGAADALAAAGFAESGGGDAARSTPTRPASSACRTHRSIGDFFICASEVSATSGSAPCTAAAASTRAPTPHDPTLRRLIDVVPFGLPDDDFDAHRRGAAAGAEGRAARHRATRHRAAVGRLAPRLAGSGDADRGRRRAGAAPARAEAGLHGDEAPQPAGHADARRRSEPRAGAALGVLDRTSSSTTGCRTPSAPAISPKPTSASARIASTSRRTSSSARGCSTTSGRGLPIVCTDGDVFARSWPSEGLGAVVPPGDVAALAHGDRSTARRRDGTRVAAAGARPPRIALEPRGGAARALLRCPPPRARPRVAAAGAVRASGPEFSPGQMAEAKGPGGGHFARAHRPDQVAQIGAQVDRLVESNGRRMGPAARGQTSVVTTTRPRFPACGRRHIPATNS